MNHSKEKNNKTLVLQAFDTLFNRRDYSAAEQYWSPNYIQHSAHIGPGREGLFNLIKGIPPTLKYEPGLIIADGGISESERRIRQQQMQQQKSCRAKKPSWQHPGNRVFGRL